MAELTLTETLYLRLTRRYVGEYAHLDEWESIGTVRHTCIGSECEDDEDPCEPMTHRYWCYVTPDEPDNPHTEKHIDQALRDHFSRWGCAHEYDCCGCRSYAVTEVKRFDTRMYEVTVYSSRNY